VQSVTEGLHIYRHGCSRELRAQNKSTVVISKPEFSKVADTQPELLRLAAPLLSGPLASRCNPWLCPKLQVTGCSKKQL